MRSLMRFNCFIKSLFNLNHSKKYPRSLSHFTNILNSNFNSDSDSIILSRFFDGFSLDNKLSLLRYDLNTNGNDPYVDDIDFPYYKPHLKFIGHSLGIVCLGCSYEFFLYNLITSKLHKLPPSILERQIHETQSSQTCAVGFGYDSKSKDFKVVKVVRFYDGRAYPHPNRVEVYNLSTNRWRVIETTVVSNVLWDPSFHMYHRGVYYWWALHKTKEILSFHFSKEIFSRIRVPEIFVAWPIRNRTMAVWNGSIVLFHCSNTEKPLVKSFDIWAMEKDESGVVSWLKISTIGPVSGVEKPLLFVNSDILIMESVEDEDKKAQVISYNIKTKELNYLPLKGGPDYIECCIFAKRLSSIKAREKVDIGIS